jgi:hypothetical protein
MSSIDSIEAESSAHLSYVGHSDQGGRPDGVQVMVNKAHAFIGHVFSGGVTVVDTTDPRKPRTVNFIATPANSWSIHLQTHGDLMLVINEFDFYSAYPDERDYYGRSVNDIPDVPFAAGIRVFDIKNPAEPKEIGFMPVEGKGVHRIWWDGGRYAYISVLPWGFTDHIFAVVDPHDPVHPVEIGRWWMPGMWTAGGEQPDWTGRWALHHAVVADNIAYCGWRDGGLILLDVKDPAAPSLLGHRNWCPPFGGGTHSGLPLADRGLCLAPDEATQDDCADGIKRIWVTDVREPSNPVTISTFPVPEEADYCAKGGHFGPHNVHENRTDSFQSSELIFATYQNAGVRVVDLKDPFHPREVGHYVPPPPGRLVDNRPGRSNVIHTADVYVTTEGLVYITDTSGAGLYILEYGGFSHS